MSYKPEKYPEHAKLKAISDESNAIGAYIGIDYDALASELRQMLDELGELINDKEKA